MPGRRKANRLTVTLWQGGHVATGRAGLLLYWRVAAWGVVPPAQLSQLRDMVRHLASGQRADVRAAGYHAGILGISLQVHEAF